jgi:putative ABC transport system permease protein
MNRHTLFLASRSLRASPARALVLTIALWLAAVLPLGLGLALDRVGRSLMARAISSPVVVGQPGDSADLVLAALYFHGQVRTPLPWGARKSLVAAGYGPVLPIYARHSAGGTPVVGTLLEYFDARGLELEEGRRFATLGELVAGANVAKALDLVPGDTVQSDPQNLYDVAGAWPLTLRVVGVLAPTGTPDDGALFADVHTTWALDGSIHGHEAVPGTADADPNADQNDAAETVQAPAALFLAGEVNDANRGTFHLHGDLDELPLSALLIVPRDPRSHDQLLGDLAMRDDLAAVRPSQVVGALLAVVVEARRSLNLVFLLAGLSTLALAALVIDLGVRSRQAELALMVRLGASAATVRSVVAAEALLLLLAAALLTTAALAGLAVLPMESWRS